MGRLPEQYNGVAPSVLVFQCTKCLLRALFQTYTQEMPAVPLINTWVVSYVYWTVHHLIVEE